jgi:hypothetical protein
MILGNDMILIDHFKKLLQIIFFIIIVLQVIPTYTVSANNSWWDDQWEYAMPLTIPIDTSLAESKYQPIDQLITFEESCWAKNEKIHSIRICCLSNNNWDVLESQIYNLTPSDDSYITACRIIFLIPEYADGTESYFAYYSNSEKDATEYIDHISIEEAYYHYEPISGYPLESYFYKLLDDAKITYIVSKEGQFMGYNTGQHITKMLPDTTEVLPKNGDLFAAFDFKYCYDDGLFDYSSTSQKIISKEIFIDGNLMTSFGIVTQSKLDDMKTTVHYTYYHCPTDTTRIRVHVRHETLASITAVIDSNTDGTYATLQSGGAKSNSIKDLNIGEILPYMNFINEYNEISSYKMDLDPEYIPEEPDIRVVEITDDIDIGSHPWISFNEGEEGIAHAVIFHGNKVIKSGTDEKDGIQLNAFQMDYPHLTGLENNMATIQVGRNSYEPETGHDRSIPDDLIVEFDAEFFTSRNGGTPAIEKESEIYQQILDQMLQNDTSYEIDEEVADKYELSVLVHQAESFPMGSAFAALTGINFSFITVELYQNDVYHSSETAVRIPMNPLDQEVENVKEVVYSVLHVFDLRNISFFKKVTFQDIYEGQYTIKIIRDNFFLSSGPEYIGYASVDLSSDETISIICSKEKTIQVEVIDQHEQPVNKVDVRITKDGYNVSKGTTNQDGFLTLCTPYDKKAYHLEVWYQGFCFYDEPIILHFLDIKKNNYQFDIQRYILELSITDTWDLPIGISLQPILLNSEGTGIGNAEIISNSEYIFNNLPPMKYTLVLTFKSFTYKKDIDLNENTAIAVTFPAEFSQDVSFLDNRALPLTDISIQLKRDGKVITKHSELDHLSLDLPPGIYQVIIIQNDEIIGKRDLSVIAGGTYDFITSNQPIFPIIGILSIILFAFMLSWYGLKRKKGLKLLTIIPIILVLCSLFVSWWSIQGSINDIETKTDMYLLLGELISFISSSDVIAGSQDYLPEIFDTMIVGSIFLVCLSAALLCVDLFFSNKLENKTIILQFLVIIFLIGIIGIFSFAMSSLSEISVGTFIGSGDLSISIPGKNDHVTIPCSWGPSLGYYAVIIATIIYISYVVYQNGFIRHIKNVLLTKEKC